jgi:hypothetical protein
MPRCLDCGVSIKQGYTYCYEHHRRHVQEEERNRESDARSSEARGIFGALLIRGIIDIFKEFFSLFNNPPSWIEHKIPRWHINGKFFRFLVRVIVSFLSANIISVILVSLFLKSEVILIIVFFWPIWVITWKISGWIFPKP